MHTYRQQSIIYSLATIIESWLLVLAPWNQIKARPQKATDELIIIIIAPIESKTFWFSFLILPKHRSCSVCSRRGKTAWSRNEFIVSIKSWYWPLGCLAFILCIRLGFCVLLLRRRNEKLLCKRYVIDLQAKKRRKRKIYFFSPFEKSIKKTNFYFKSRTSCVLRREKTRDVLYFHFHFIFNRLGLQLCKFDDFVDIDSTK